MIYRWTIILAKFREDVFPKKKFSIQFHKSFPSTNTKRHILIPTNKPNGTHRSNKRNYARTVSFFCKNYFEPLFESRNTRRNIFKINMLQCVAYIYCENTSVGTYVFQSVRNGKFFCICLFGGFVS